MSRLEFALRTLVGPWLVLPALGLEAVIFAQRGMPWRGEGMWTVEWFGIALFILGPLCAGAAAVDAARLSRPGNIHLILSVSRRGQAFPRAALWCGIPVVTLHLLAITVGEVVGQVTRPSISWWAILLATAVQCLLLVWFVAIGSAIGRFTSPVLAGLIGGSAGFILGYLIGDASAGDRFQLLAVGAATVSRIGYAYHIAYLVGQVIILLGTAALLLLLPMRSRSGHRVPTPVGSGVVVAVLVMILVGISVLPSDRLVRDPQAPDYCVGTRPQVCLYYEHRRFAGLVNTQIQKISRAALAAGYPAYVPDKVIESSRTYFAGGPGIRPLMLHADAYEKGQVPIEAVMYELVAPSHCAQLHAPEPPSERFNERFFSLLATWQHLLGEDLQRAPVSYQLLTPDEVQTILDDFARCDLDGRG